MASISFLNPFQSNDVVVHPVTANHGNKDSQDRAIIADTDPAKNYNFKQGAKESEGNDGDAENREQQDNDDEQPNDSGSGKQDQIASTEVEAEDPKEKLIQEILEFEKIAKDRNMPNEYSFQIPIPSSTNESNRVMHAFLFYSNDGKPWLMTVNIRCVIGIWDMISNNMQVKFTKHKNMMKAYAIDPDSNRIVTGDIENHIYIWNFSDGSIFHHLENVKHGSGGLSIRHPKPENQVLIVASEGIELKVFDLINGSLIYSIEFKNIYQIYAMAAMLDISSNAKKGYEAITIFIGNNDGNIYGYGWKQDRESFVLQGHKEEPSCLVTDQVRYDNRQYPILISGGGIEDKNIIIWDLILKEPMHILKGHKHAILSLVVCDDGISRLGAPPMLFSSSFDETIILWDLITGDRIRTLQYAPITLGLSVLCAETGNIVLTVDDGNLAGWNLCKTPRNQKIPIPRQEITAMTIYQPRVDDTMVSSPILVLGVCDDDDEGVTIKLYDLKTFEPIATKFPKENSDMAGAYFYAFMTYAPTNIKQSPLLIAQNRTNNFKVLDLLTLEIIRSVDSEESIRSFALYDPRKCSEKAKLSKLTESDLDLSVPLLVVTCGYDDAVIKIWNFLTESIMHKKSAFESSIQSMAIHHPQDESMPLLITSSPGSQSKIIRIWNLQNFTFVKDISNKHEEWITNIALYDPLAHLSTTAMEQLSPSFRNLLLIQTCKDGTASICNLKTEDVLHRLEGGHTGNIMSLKIYIPINHEDHPIVITGGEDGLINLWNMFSGERLQMLCRTTLSPIQFLVIYDLDPNIESKLPYLLSSNEDDCYVMKWDQYLLKRMPSSHDIQHIYQIDAKVDAGSPNAWTHMQAMVATYGHQIFVENTNLFYLAVHQDRDDFLQTFQSALEQHLPYLKSYERESILAYAIKKKNLQAIRILVAAWMVALQQSMSHSLMLFLYHPSYFINFQDLCDLAKDYPSEWIELTTSLTLISTYESHSVTIEREVCEYDEIPVAMELSVASDHIHHRRKSVTTTHFLHTGYYWQMFESLIDYLTPWFKSNKTAVNADLTYYIIPMYNGLTSTFLQNGMKVTEVTQNMSMLDNEVIQCIIQYKWEHVIKYYFLFDFLLLFILTVNFLINAILFDWYVKGSSSRYGYLKTLGMVMISVSLFICTYFLTHEYWQMESGSGGSKKQKLQKIESNKSLLKGIQSYISDGWNCLHLTTNVFIILASSFQALALSVSTTDSIQSYYISNGSILAASTMPLLACEFLFYLGGLPATGSLVRMVIKITQGTGTFMIILLVFLLTFAGSFVILFQNIDREALEVEFDGYTTYAKALMTVYGFLFGTYSLSELTQSRSPFLALLLLSIFLFFIVIILLNLLIAIMGDKYDEVQDNVVAERYYGLAKLVLEYEAISNHFWIPVQYPSMIQVQLMKDKDLINDGDNWQGKLNAIRSKIDESDQKQRQKLEEIRRSQMTLKDELIKLISPNQHRFDSQKGIEDVVKLQNTQFQALEKSMVELIKSQDIFEKKIENRQKVLETKMEVLLDALKDIASKLKS